MSDDEEYYDEYDEDIFWIEEPDPGLADDLAETAHYDPLFMDDPSYEVEDYWSDWDEASDEYYDEEPTAVKRQRVTGGQSTKKQNDSAHQKTHNGDAQDISSLKPNTESFQGVIWKNPSQNNNAIKLYEPGDGEKVALLKNWREVFKNSHPSIGRSRVRKGRALGSMDSDTVPRSGAIGDLMEDVKKRDDSSDRTSGISSLENLRETDVESSTMSNTTPGKSVSPPPAQGTDLPKDSKSKTKKGPSSTGTKSNESHKESAPSSLPSPSPRGKKRRAPDEHDNNTQEDAKKPRSKRIAAKKVGEDDNSTQASSAPVRRSTRQSKK